MRRRNPGEADRWASYLRSGQVTPPAVERRISELTIALEDAVGLGYEQSKIDQIRESIRGLEEALREAKPAWEEAARQRLSSYSDPVPARYSRPAGRDAVPVGDAELVQAQKDLATLRRLLESAIKYRDPHDEIVELRRKVADAEDAVAVLERRSKRTNPKKRGRRVPLEVAEASRDVASGRVDARDVMKRVEHYREVLVEVLANDPGAKRKIDALVERIRGLEDLVLRLGTDRVA